MKITQDGIVKQVKIFFLLSLVALLGVTAFCDGQIQLKSNLLSMPVIDDQSYYDNEVIYKDDTLNNPLADLVEPIIDEYVNKGLPGIVVLIDESTNGTYVCAKGVIDLKNNIPIKKNSISRIGSITKMFTGVVILQLFQEDKISLDDKISKYLSQDVIQSIENADQVTIRQLLNHTSGIYNYTDIQDPFKYYSIGNNKDQTSQNCLKLISYRHSYFPPGTGFRYSNSNYLLLGLIIEQVTHKRLKDIFQARIFTPLQLKSTYFDPDHPFPKNLARGYIDINNEKSYLDCTYFDEACRTPDGGVTSCVYDMAAFIKAVFHDRHFLKPTAFEQMTGDMVNASGMGMSGLAIFGDDLGDGVTVYGHSGGHYSYSAELFYLPSKKITFAALVNTSRHFSNSSKTYAEFRLELFKLIANL
jgi:D-alanyl-D-alanine carboxypeptidase